MLLDTVTIIAGVLALTLLAALVAAERRRLAAEWQKIDLERGMLTVEREMLTARQRARQCTPRRCPQCGHRMRPGTAPPG